MHNRVFYHIYPLGLLGSPKINSFDSEPKELLCELDSWLNHLSELGCNALYLGPVFESTSHGYDTADYYSVDRRLGTNESLVDIIEKAHQLGVKVVFDAVFNHVGRDFWAFKDLQRNGKKSLYKNWFSNIDFTKKSPHGDSFSYSSWRGHYQLVELNLENDEVKKHLFGAVRFWVEEFKIDGLRLDTADVLDFKFMRELSKYCKQLKPDFWLMGEVVQGDYRKWIGRDMLDSVTNYDYHSPLYQSFNENDFDRLSTILNRQYGPTGKFKKLHLYSFVDNHDVNRAASDLNKPEHLYPLYLLLFTLPGIPALYYGSEWGFEGEKKEGSDAELRPHVVYDKRFSWVKHPDLFNSLKRFIELRKTIFALAEGDFEEVLVQKKIYAFLRYQKNEMVLVIVNSDKCSRTVYLKATQIRVGNYRDVLNDINYLCAEQKGLKLVVSPNWGAILQYLG